MQQKQQQLAQASQEASISIKRNRVKVYPNSTVYLKDKQEFEIELFNPTSTTRLAKILIDGKYISQSGIVLRPGERLYLERFLDSPEKFRFDTYVINGNDKAAIAATVNNGSVQVEFYDEIISSSTTYTTTIDWNCFHSTWPGTTGHSTVRGSFTNSSGGGSVTSFSSGQSSPLFTTTSTADLADSLDMSEASTDWMEQPKERGIDFVPKETGKVEKGAKSDQGFIEYNGIFSIIKSKIVTIKILPLSEKPLESKDISLYCSNCGSKRKKSSHNFCPVCGEKF